MPQPSKEELDADMMAWHDELQRNKKPLEKREIQVEVQTFYVREESEAPPAPPPDEIYPQ